MSLSEESIGQAIKEVAQYKKRIIEKTELLRQRVAEELANEVRSGFAVAVCDDLLKGGGHSPDVSVSIENTGGITLVIASGEDAVWVEFGSGVYHNTSVGTSPHPKGAELGLTIGSYGFGMGARTVWGFYEDGELKLTHGTRAQMPMYHAVVAVGNRVSQIAKEVFRT